MMNFGAAPPALQPMVIPAPPPHGATGRPMPQQPHHNHHQGGMSIPMPMMAANGRPSSAHPRYMDNNNNQTVEVVQISATMDPIPLLTYAPSLQAQLVVLYTGLPKADAAFLKMVECFVFLYRPRLPHESTVMPNAAFYLNRLQRCGSPLATQLDKVVGFRCCGCRHTTQQNPSQYVGGAAQLVNVQHLAPQPILKSLLELRQHLLACQHVPKHIKNNLISTGSARGPSRLLTEYIELWFQFLEGFAQKKGYPPLPQRAPPPVARPPTNNRKRPAVYNNNNGSRNGHHSHQRPQPASNHHNNNQRHLPSVGNLHAALGATVLHQQQQQQWQHQQQQRKPPPPGSIVRPPNNHTMNPPPPPIPAVPYTIEDELFSSLEHCREQACAENNFGLESLKNRIVVTDLSKLPIATTATSTPVSPLLEVLLQAYAAVQRWNELEAAVYWECIYCNEHAFCASTATAEQAAQFIMKDSFVHLTTECSKARSTLQQKLIRMMDRMSNEERDQQAKIVRDNFASWKRLFPYGGGQSNASSKVATTSSTTAGRRKTGANWRPMTWRFLSETEGASLCTKKLAWSSDNTSESALTVNANKRLPYKPNDNDVLIGWNGSHKGNRKFMDLLHEMRPVFNDDTVTKTQRHILAMTAVETIAKRGGRFFVVGSNHQMPPTGIPPQRSVWYARRALQYGAMVILQPSSSSSNGHTKNKTGRGSCVQDLEYAPQVDLFTNEVVKVDGTKQSSAQLLRKQGDP